MIKGYTINTEDECARGTFLGQCAKIATLNVNNTSMHTNCELSGDGRGRPSRSAQCLYS